MTAPILFTEPQRVDEPRAAQEFSDALTQVAAQGKAVIVCRNGADLAALIPLEHLELVRETLARQEVEKLAAQIDWERARTTLRPPPEWFEGEEPKPF
jgi:PHD/YefM family antitoxin component YafN of YafNO toxin-antitoxin module